MHGTYNWCLKNFVLTCAKEKDQGNLESMVERALNALRFAPNATLKIWPPKHITAGRQKQFSEILRKNCRYKTSIGRKF